jgi:hypothetical protein
MGGTRIAAAGSIRSGNRKSGDQIFGSGTYMGWNGQQGEYGQLQLEGAKTPAAASIPVVGLEQGRHGSRHSIPNAD